MSIYAVVAALCLAPVEHEQPLRRAKCFPMEEKRRTLIFYYIPYTSNVHPYLYVVIKLYNVEGISKLSYFKFIILVLLLGEIENFTNYILSRVYSLEIMLKVSYMCNLFCVSSLTVILLFNKFFMFIQHLKTTKMDM